MSDEFDGYLSAVGETRREEILQLAHRAVRSRRRRRAVGRVVMAVVAISLIVAALPRPRHVPAPDLAVRPVVKHPDRPSTIAIQPRPLVKQIVITRIENDPVLLARLRIPPGQPTWETLSDDGLLRSLNEAGRPAGLAYVGGHTMILFRTPTR